MRSNSWEDNTRDTGSDYDKIRLQTSNEAGRQIFHATAIDFPGRSTTHVRTGAIVFANDTV